MLLPLLWGKMSWASLIRVTYNAHGTELTIDKLSLMRSIFGRTLTLQNVKTFSQKLLWVIVVIYSDKNQFSILLWNEIRHTKTFDTEF